VVEDKLLIWRLRRGSRDALSLIYEKYRDDLLRIAAGLLNETSAAEDIVQDVFVTFVRSAMRFQLTGSLRGYLATCVANKARNLNRAKSIQRTINLDEIEPRASNLKRPERWIINNEEFRQLNAAMGQLPYEQKEAVILHIQGRLKFREIARIQDTPVKTVLSRYRYGLNKLRSVLDGEVTK
jgi:RNA polymerase sigma-70 factor (ECF subfamily)